MARALSVLDLAKQAGTNGRHGAAHRDPRDAYQDVPILQQPTWNNEIAGYFYFGGISSGALTIGALADLVGGERQRGLARMAQAVAFCTMAPCAPLLIADLGRRSRFHHMLRLFKPSSPMNLGAWTLTAHGAFSTLLVLRQLAEARKLPLLSGLLGAILPRRLLAAGGVPSALTLGGYTGVLLGTTAVPVWATSPLLGALFMASSLSTGGAAIRLVASLTGHDHALSHEALSPLLLAFGATELGVIAAYYGTSGPATKHLLQGRARYLLTGASAASLVGMALEVASSRSLGSRRLLGGFAAGAALLGGAMLRWGIVMAGHESAEDRETQLQATRPSPEAPGWGPNGPLQP